MKPEEILAALATLFDDHKAEVAALQREVAHQTRTAEQWRLSYVEEKQLAKEVEAKLIRARTITEKQVYRVVDILAQEEIIDSDLNRCEWVLRGVRRAIEGALKEGNV